MSFRLSQDRELNGVQEWSRESHSTSHFSLQLAPRPLCIPGGKMAEYAGFCSSFQAFVALGHASSVSIPPGHHACHLSSAHFVSWHRFWVVMPVFIIPYARLSQPSFGCISFCLFHKRAQESHQLLPSNSLTWQLLWRSWAAVLKSSDMFTFLPWGFIRVVTLCRYPWFVSIGTSAWWGTIWPGREAGAGAGDLRWAQCSQRSMNQVVD